MSNVQSLSDFVEIINNVLRSFLHVAHDTSVFVVISAKDTKRSFTSIDKWNQIDRQCLITLEKRDVNEICQAMTWCVEKRTRTVEERFRFKIKRVFKMRDDDKIYPAEGNQTTNCVINFVAYPIFLFTSLSRFFIFCFAFFRILSPLLCIL